MKKRVIAAIVIIVIIAAAGYGIQYYDRWYTLPYKNTLTIEAYSNGNKIDLTDIDVDYSTGIAGTEPPMGTIDRKKLSENDGVYSTEFATSKYWEFSYKLILPKEKTGFCSDILISFGEDAVPAYKDGGYTVKAEVNSVSETEADVVINLNRHFLNRRGEEVSIRRDYEKRITKDSSTVESIIYGSYYGD